MESSIPSLTDQERKERDFIDLFEQFKLANADDKNDLVISDLLSSQQQQSIEPPLDMN